VWQLQICGCIPLMIHHREKTPGASPAIAVEALILQIMGASAKRLRADPGTFGVENGLSG